MSDNKIPTEVKEIKYKTLESERIVYFSTLYAVVSLVLIGVVFRIWPPIPQRLCSIESIILIAYTSFSAAFIFYIGEQSRRRTLLNKLPPIDIIKLCKAVDINSNHGKPGFSGNWHTTYAAFNQHAMETLIRPGITKIIPAHDYFSYMLAEKLIETPSITDKGPDKYKNTLSISLSDKARQRIDIYDKSKYW